MPWAITLEVVDAAVPSFKLVGASVSDDTIPGSGVTDANGQLIYVVADEFSQYIVRISHPGATVHAAFGYINKNFTLNKSSAGTIQVVPLNPAPDPGTGTGTTKPPKCFIVSATTGSRDSAEVTHLRQLRDRVATASRVGGQLIDEIYREYAQFSPAIAIELERDLITQKAVLWGVVRPLLAWYSLAGVLAFEPANQTAIDLATRDLKAACPRYLGGESIIGLLEAVHAGAPLPAGTNPLLVEFAPRLQAAARLRCASWAILDPLLRTWRSATERLDVADQVGQWLATAPLDVLTPPGAPDVLEAELHTLAGFLAFKPLARRQLGERLTAAWPDAASAIARAGFGAANE